ncbi:MAG: calcium-translocating P-type ATPase, PMCA-type [Christensenellaceae bacterium]|jgi:Ca2+-transporting ATPase|nr:calcium-translocating P-type ATPase, PMCA-type [Christensenellaceae bacterium]
MAFYNRTQDDIFEELKTSKNGLSDAEAAKRLSENGKNAFAEEKKKSVIYKFFMQMKDIMVIVLIVAALVSAVIAIIEAQNDAKKYYDLIDSGIIFLIVLINATIGVIQDNKAEASLSALKNLNKPFAKVIRNGEDVKIKSEDIVIGDIVVLEAGDIVPADMRLLETASLKVEEAALTGESLPSSKNAEIINQEEVPLGDRKNMCFSSGVVSYGRGQGVVTATGMGTEVGKIAVMLQESDEGQTPLQAQLAKTAKLLSVAVLAIAAVIFAVVAIRSLVAGHTGTKLIDEIIGAFMTAVAIAVAAIPEGLPAVVTIVLAVGVQSMSRKNAIVRNLPAVESLGCCEVICSDKTGTITLNQMTVKELYTPSNGIYPETEAIENDALLLAKTLYLCNDTRKSEGRLIGDPTETALVAYADALNISFIDKRVGEIPFDSSRKLMTTVNEAEDGKRAAYVKGAPDILIKRCDRILVNGKIRPITEGDIAEIHAANAKMAEKALRVLAGAVKFENLDKNLDDSDKYEQNLIFVGLSGMIDPAREEVKGAVETCRKAGMRAVMITGDHIDTARAIAKQVGILTEGGLVITGADLDKLSDEEFINDIDRYCVFARVSPENKVRIVKSLQKAGKKVAMTGDGVNDAPSIKAADIGVGMGITGTDVSKGAADMVLADDNFATIVSAVEEGRKVYSNIKKAIQYLLSANIAEVLCLFVVTIFFPDFLFLSPVMILWVNLVTDSLPALALGMEKTEGDVMNDPPRKSGSSLFSGTTGRDILIQGAFQTLLVLASYFIGIYVLGGTPQEGGNRVPETMAFVTLSLVQLFHAYNMRSQKKSLFATNPFANKFMNVSFIVCLGLLLFSVVIPGVGTNLFDCAESMTAPQWLTAIFLSVAVIPLVELQKLIGNAITKKKAHA